MNKIILIEDDEIDTLQFKRALTQSGLDLPLQTFDRVEAGIAHLEKRENAEGVIVFLDLSLPGMSGFDFLKTIRAMKHLKTLPVLVATTSTDPIDFKKAHTYRVSAYLAKPITADILREQLVSLLLPSSQNTAR